MHTIVIPISDKLSHECIMAVCLYFNITATRLDKRDSTWCLESDDAVNFFWLGMNWNNKVTEYLEKH